MRPTILYLLAKPGTPKSACDEVLNHATNGEKISVAEVKETIAKHKAGESVSAKPIVALTRRHATPRLQNHAALQRQVKLDEDFLRIRGTTLDHPKELDALCHLKDYYEQAYRDIIERVVVAGEQVSAVEWMDRIARHQPLPPPAVVPTEPGPKPVEIHQHDRHIATSAASARRFASGRNGRD